MSLKKRITIILFLLGVLVLTKLTFGKTQTEKLEINSIFLYLLPNIEERMKVNIWLVNLKPYENCPIDGIIDTNLKRSSGTLCFQDETFFEFVKEYNILPYAEDHEIINLVGDEDTQFRAAREALLDDPNNTSRWITSVRRGAGVL